MESYDLNFKANVASKSVYLLSLNRGPEFAYVISKFPSVRGQYKTLVVSGIPSLGSMGS